MIRDFFVTLNNELIPLHTRQPWHTFPNDKALQLMTNVVPLFRTVHFDVCVAKVSSTIRKTLLSASTLTNAGTAITIVNRSATLSSHGMLVYILKQSFVHSWTFKRRILFTYFTYQVIKSRTRWIVKQFYSHSQYLKNKNFNRVASTTKAPTSALASTDTC